MADEELNTSIEDKTSTTTPPINSPDELPSGDSFNGNELAGPTDEKDYSEEHNGSDMQGSSANISNDEEEDDGYHGTKFATIYNRFLGKITDDMYMELTPEDTARDLQNLLIDAIPGFEFPRVIIEDYKLKVKTVNQSDVKPGEFILAVLWQELSEDGEETEPEVVVDNSCFKAQFSSEEINILAILMKLGWIQRQISSVEVTRMKYSGADFKMTSQANHLSRLMALAEQVKAESRHAQRLYKRRKVDSDGRINSNWGSIMENHVFR